jgi:site-specific DNA recombinase
VEHRRHPYGYTAEKVPHPVAFKAAQGRTKTRLILDQARAGSVAAIFRWRTREKIGAYTIACRLNADPAAYPPPGVGYWSEPAVYAILRNPKYTGHMVFGRSRTVNGRTRPLPPDQWLWSPQPATPPSSSASCGTDAAQAIGAEHSTSRGDPGMNSHRAARRTYVLRSRIRCRSCKRRMCGMTRSASGCYQGGERYSYTYYICPHNPDDPRHTASDHQRVISVREDALLEVIRQFFAQRIFGPDRAAVLTARIPATISGATPQTLASILNDANPATAPTGSAPARPGFSDLAQAPVRK